MCGECVVVVGDWCVDCDWFDFVGVGFVVGDCVGCDGV